MSFLNKIAVYLSPTLGVGISLLQDNTIQRKTKHKMRQMNIRLDKTRTDKVRRNRTKDKQGTRQTSWASQKTRGDADGRGLDGGGHTDKKKKR